MSQSPTGVPPRPAYTTLSSYHQCRGRMEANWAAFLARREARLAQQQRYGQAAEKVAEDILTDLFTNVLDWPLEGMNYQVERADFVLTALGIKRLVIEAKRPGTLQWQRTAVAKALEQAWRYAAEQKIACVAVSDGELLYAEDWEGGGARPRLLVRLNAAEAAEDLWWLSRDGVYRAREGAPVIAWPRGLIAAAVPAAESDGSEVLRHKKYRLPARCFAYVPDPSRPNTWKLPYLLADGQVDGKRLPKAIQCILTNYRGAHADIPEAAIPGVLRTLEEAARSCGLMPDQRSASAAAYRQLAQALAQLRRGDPNGNSL